NEAMYQQFKVDRGRKDHWAMYPAPDKVPVFYEDEDGNRIDPKKAARPTPRQVIETVLTRQYPDVMTTSAEPSAVDAKKIKELAEADEPPVYFPPAASWGTLTRKPARFQAFGNAIQVDEANHERRDRLFRKSFAGRSGATRRRERETFLFEGRSGAENVDGVTKPLAQVQAEPDLKPL